MKAAFDEIMATAVKRQHEPQRIVGDLLNAEINEKQARSIKYQLTIAKLSRSTRRSSTISLPAASSLSNATSCWSAALAPARPTWPSPSPEAASDPAPAAVSTTWSISSTALKAATSSIPIVGVTSDPVAFGIVTSLARPGGNITGVVGDGGPEFWEKHVEIVRAALPTVSKVAYLSPRALWDGVTGATTREAAARLGMTMLPQLLDDPIDETAYRRAFAWMVEQRAETLLVGDAPENFTNQDLIIASAEHAKLPAVYPDGSFVRRGGFLSHGIDYDELFRYASKEIDQIFRGAAPADLPFYRTTKILLAINLKSAKKLGVSVPFTLLATADEVIE